MINPSYEIRVAPRDDDEQSVDLATSSSCPREWLSYQEKVLYTLNVPSISIFNVL